MYHMGHIYILYIRAGEPANFLAAPAPAPDFFFQAAPAPDFFPKRLRLRLLVFFSSGSGSGSKGTKTPSSDRLRLLGKIFFSPQTSKVKLQKKY